MDVDSTRREQSQPQTPPDTPAGPAEAEISIAVRYPGGRAEKLLRPLSATDMAVGVEPADPYSYDIVIADNADRDLGKEVLRNRLTDSKLVYRVRGDIFHELDLWEMAWYKELAARRVVLPNVDGVIAVTPRLAQKYGRQTGLEQCHAAGLAKDPANWPNKDHYRQTIEAVTLTNMNYWKKIAPIVEWASVVEEVLADVGGHWRVCGEGKHSDRLERALSGYDHVTHAGYVDADAQLAQSNLMLHPSLLDGQPNSILEGLASRLPVITNDFHEFVDYGGPLEIASTGRELEQLLRAYADPELRAAKGIKGESYIDTHHSERAVGEKYVRACQEILA